MFAAKPLASLSSGLLARKGQARPAMRPQAFADPAPAASEDLGWNDMGPTPEPELPPVLVERETLREEVEAAAPTTVADSGPVPTFKAPPIRAARGAKAKAAFTLRLEPTRHLRLRLASAVSHLSAQQLVVQALDAFLATLPDVEELARQCPASERSGS